VITGKLDGIADLKRSIARLDRKLSREGPLDKALRKAAEMFQAEAQRRVPVKTGKLRDSIKVRRSGKGFRVKPGEKYAGYIEFGTQSTKAQPYMRPAFDEVQPKAIESIADDLRRGVVNGA